MFYIDTTTKKFIAGPQASNSTGECCYCCEGSDVPLFLRTKVANPSLIKKPILIHYETAIIQLSLRDSQGFPYDLTDKELVLAVDNTFQHSDSLIALSSQFLVLDAQQGVVQFTVKCSSKKFQKMVNNKIPASQVYMQITSYSQQDIQGTVILQDRGITLQPKLYTTQGIPEDNDPNYYNKQQTRSVIAAYIKIAEAQSNSEVQQALLDFIHSEFYDKGEVDSYIGQLSDSFNVRLQELDNYTSAQLSSRYTKDQTDLISSNLNASIGTVSSTLNSAITAVDSSLQGLHIQKAQTPQQGYTATYHLKDSQGNTKGDPINVLQDSFLKSAAFITAAAQDHTADPSVVVGDPYLKFQFYVQKDGSQTTSIQYVPLKDLVDVYTAGDGLQGTSQFSIKVANNVQTAKYLQVNSSGLAVKGIDSALGNVSSTFSSYYTKPEVDGISGTLNSAIQNTDGKFASYYTSSQVNAISSTLNASIGTVNASLSSYYTSTQVNNISSALNAAIETASSAVNGSFASYYASSQVDQLLAQLSNSVDLSDYYKKSQVDAISSTLNTSIGTVNSSFVSYYTSTQVNNISSNLNSTISDVNDRFGSYYTSAQVSGLIKQLSDSIVELKGAFASYYTSAQVNNISSTLNASIGAVDGKFASYYNSTEVNGISSTLNASFGNYYNSSQVDTVSSTLNTAVNTASSNLNTSIANVSSTLVSYYYTGAQVEGFIDDLSNSIQAVKNSLGSYCTNTSASAISSILNSSIGAVNTSLGSYYTSIQVNNISSTLSSAIGTVDNKFTSYYTSTQVNSFISDISDSISDLRGTFGNYYNKSQVQALIDQLSGDKIISLTSTAITPQHETIFKKTLAASDVFTIDTSGVVSSRQVTFELHLIQPSTAVSFTFPSTLMWGQMENFSSSNAAPDMSSPNVLYCIVIRWDGANLLANLAYSKAVSA